MTTVRQAGLLFLLAGLGAAALTCQRETVAAQTVSPQRVTIYFMARDSRGKIVSNIVENEVRLSADGKPQTIEQFLSPAQAPPLTVGLLFDVSGSMEKFHLPDARVLFLNFFQGVISPGSHGFVAEFSQSANPLGAMSDDPAYLAAAATETFEPKGRTALRDAIHWVFSNIVANRSGRIALVLWTDGQDNASQASMKTIEEDAQRLDASVYVVNFDDPMGFSDVSLEQENGPDLLKQLAAKTGGVSEPFTWDHKVNPAVARIAEDLRNTYTISFTPTPYKTDGEFQKLKVKIERRGVNVFAREGYFAPKN